MLSNALLVLSYVIILFVLIGIGFVSNKIKLISSNGIKDLTNLVLYIVTPCILINSYQREFNSEMLVGLGYTVLASFISFVINILISHLVVRDKDKRREKTLVFGSVFSNCGFMSLPLQNAILGSEGVFYGATYVAVFQIMIWTYGVILMSGDMKNISWKKVLINPGVLGTVAGIIIFIFSIKIPFVISEPISFLAALNTPIPMIIVGYRLADASLKIKGAGSWISIILRLIISPIIMIGILYFMGISGAIMVACTVAAAAPCAANTTMFAEKFGGDVGLSSAMVSITTLLSVITMPVIVALSMIL